LVVIDEFLTVLCTIVAHNIAQNRPDSFPPYPPDINNSERVPKIGEN